MGLITMMKANSIHDVFLKIVVLCWGVVIFIILVGCTITYAGPEYDEPTEGVGYLVLDEPDVTEVTDETEELTEIEVPLEVEETEDEVDLAEEWPERVAFLTIDDGPSFQTARILDILYEEEVPAIFFLLGHSMITNTSIDSQALMERILAEGHYIGLHSMTHNYNTLYRGDGAPGRFVDEMFELQGMIYDMVGHHTNLCRAPFGMMTGFRPEHHIAVAEAGINCIDWNIDPQDWRSEYNAQIILGHVTDQVERLNFPPELVIVMHEYGRTADALPLIIAFLREHGYVFKTYVPGYEFIYERYRLR